MNAGKVILGLIIGAVLGAIGGSLVLGVVAGTVIGHLLSQLSMLESRLNDLDRSFHQLRGRSESAVRRVETSSAIAAEAQLPPDATPLETTSGSSPGVAHSKDQAGDAEPHSTSRDEPGTTASWDASWHDRVPGPTGAAESLRPVYDKLLRWFTTGNVTAKVGVIISFFGVSFLLKYAIDHEYLRFPIEFRLLAVAAGAIAMIVIGWRLRRKMTAYARSLQGGGIGILFLTIFSALRVWQLLPPAPAFLLLIALTLCAGALAVLQNARSLAILGIVGGFLAPLLTATGQGNHVALFGYYLVLNAAILGIAWHKAWRLLNLLGFLFTFVIGSVWGYQYYKPELFTSTEPFLVLHFLLYQAVAVLYALRQPPARLGVVDGTLVFGTPVIAFALQASLLQGSEYGLAISAAVLAVAYALLASWLFRNRDAYLKLLTESFMALAVVFATLAIPLALDARWTSAAWALEGAALVWISVRQRHTLAGAAGIALIFFSGGAFITQGWNSSDTNLPLLNGDVTGGLLVSLSAFFASRKLAWMEERKYASPLWLVSAALFSWGVLWWFGTGLFEIMNWRPGFEHSHQLLMFWSLSAALAAWLGRRLDWTGLYRVSAGLLPLMLLSLAFNWLHDGHALFALGWPAWALAFALQVRLLRLMDESGEPQAKAWHVGSLWLLAFLLTVEASWRAGQAASEAWAVVAAVITLGVMAMLVWRFRNTPAWPVPRHANAYLASSILLVACQVLFLTAMSLHLPGDADPWPYVPVLNPLDMGMLFALLTSILSVLVANRSDATAELDLKHLGAYRRTLVAAFLILTTAALVRGVHQYTGVSWHFATLFDAGIVQASLSIYWGVLGFTGMVWGAHSARRAIWMGGAGFMGLTVIKLFLVDLANTDTVERIVSFIGIGLLLLIVGYFAPAPPKQQHAVETKIPMAGE